MNEYTCAECERQTTTIRNFHGLYLCPACFDYEKRGETEILTIIESKGFISATL